jgi:hypothetical protein
LSPGRLARPTRPPPVKPGTGPEIRAAPRLTPAGNGRRRVAGVRFPHRGSGGGASDGRVGRRGGGHAGPRPPAGIPRRPRAGDRRAEGRVRGRSADRGRIRRAARASTRVTDVRGTDRGHRRPPRRTRRTRRTPVCARSLAGDKASRADYLRDNSAGHRDAHRSPRRTRKPFHGGGDHHGRGHLSYFLAGRRDRDGLLAAGKALRGKAAAAVCTRRGCSKATRIMPRSSALVGRHRQ